MSFDPQAGHEQAGRRPAFVLLPEPYNRKAGLFLACPVTSKAKGYPFGVPIPPGLPVAGVILADQIKSLDWRTRKAEYAARAPDMTIDDVVARVLPLIDDEEEIG